MGFAFGYQSLGLRTYDFQSNKVDSLVWGGGGMG